VKNISANPHDHRELLQACLAPQRPADFDKIVQQTELAVLSEPDPEPWYYEGAIFAFCGQNDSALHLLKSAVESNYCAYSALLSDPLLAKLRADPRFSEILTDADNCQKAVQAPHNP